MTDKKTEHAFKTIQRNVKLRSLKNVILLCGEEQFLVDWSRKLIFRTFADHADVDFTHVDGSEITLAKIKECCETFSMVSGVRILEIRDFPLLWHNEARCFSKNDAAALIEYLEKIPQSSMLIFTGQNPDKKSRKKSKLIKAIEKAGTVYDFGPLDMKSLRGFINKRFKSAGIEARPDIISKLIAESGYTNREIEYGLYQLDNDIKKIIAHCKDGKAEPEDVDVALSVALETNIFALLDSISENNKAEAFRLMHDLIVSGENVFGLLSMIVSQLELLLQVKEMHDEGFELTSIAKTLKVHEFRIKKALPIIRKRKIEDIRRWLIKAYEIDKNIKTGFMEQDFAIEFFISEI